MGISTMLGRSASVAQKSASPCLQLLNSSIQQQNVQPARGMANLKAIAIRLKSVKNIQKITQSMKMVSAAKYARAERELKAARPYGEGAQSFYTCAEVGAGEEEKKDAPKKELYVALTSDRGLCGAVHSSICKSIRNELLEKPNLDNVGIICVGDKSRAQLGRLFSKNIICVGSEIGRLPPQFGDAAKIASMIMTCGFEFNVGKAYYNYFKSIVSYQTTELPLYSNETVKAAPGLALYDSVDDDVLQSYLEYSLASKIYYSLKQGATSEQSSRMNAMENSSKNAGEMIDKLTIYYNRTRQAVIT